MPTPSIVLFQPRYEPLGSSMQAIAPLALLQLAAALEPAGFDVHIIDAQVAPDADARLRDLAPRALAVGITAMTGYQIQGALAAAQIVRDTAPATPIVWGGWHPSLRPDETAADDLVDIVVRGPGEATLLELATRLRDGTPWHDIAGLTFRRDGTILSTPDRPYAGLDPLRRLPFDKLDMPAYGGRRRHGDDWGANFSWVSGPPMPYTSSAGCPYRCRFCAATRVYKRQWTALPVEKTLDELEHLHRHYGVEIFYFVDPEFFIDARRAEGIMQGLLDRGLRIFWKAQVRPDHIVRLGLRRMQLAYASGCRQLEVGIESGSPEILEMVAKDAEPRAALESAALLRQVGIIGQYNLIFGFPREQQRHVDETIRFAADLKRVNPDCLLPMYYFTPHPGIPLEDEARAHGFQPPESLRAWSRFSCSYSQPVMPWIRHPRRLAARVLRAIAFYLPLAFPGEVTRGTLTHVRSRLRRWPDLLWLWPAHLLARLRVAADCYTLPWEWRLFNWATTRRAP